MMQTKMFIFSIDIDHLFQRFFIFIKVVGQCVVRWMFLWVWIYTHFRFTGLTSGLSLLPVLELSYYKSEKEIFVDEVMFYELTDLLLQKTPEEIAKENKPPLCRPRHRTCCEQSRELIWDTFEKPETSFLGMFLTSLFQRIKISDFWGLK